MSRYCILIYYPTASKKNSNNARGEYKYPANCTVDYLHGKKKEPV